MRTMYDSAFIAIAHAMPTRATTNAPTGPPIARERLNVTEFMAIAEPRTRRELEVPRTDVRSVKNSARARNELACLGLWLIAFAQRPTSLGRMRLVARDLVALRVLEVRFLVVLGQALRVVEVC